MDHKSTTAACGGIDARIPAPHVHLAVEALRALGRVVASHVTHSGQTASNHTSSSGVPLSAMCVLAEVLAEQIAQARRQMLRTAADDRVPAGEFAARLERHVTAGSAAQEASATPGERIRRFIESHYAEHLTLDSIAAAIGCARSLVAATVKRQLGVTTHRYIARMRIRQAAELIARGDKIEAVMLSVGYRGKKNFYRQFKVETGVTPAVYRQLWPAVEFLFVSGDADERPRAVAAPGPPCAPARTAVEWSSAARSVTVACASELLGVSRRTVYYWIKKGKLQTIRRPVGGQRVLVEDVDRTASRSRESVAAAGSAVAPFGRSW